MTIEEFGPQWSPGPFERGTDGPRVIVVGVDGSETSMRAGSYAGGLARRQQSRLVVVYVAATSGWTGFSAAGVAIAQETTDEIADDIRAALRDRAAEIHVPISFHTLRGDPFTELRRVATEVQADMVVVGASEQAGHRLVGSVASKLVRAATWPVVVVP